MKTYSLLDILSKEIEFEESKYSFGQIQIPIIQRDYAQGRPEQKTVRDRFLDALFTALNNDDLLDLDFVYGAIKELDSVKLFVPLDGQQRLTTLFLLYWYIGNREFVNQQERLEENRKVLKRFTYATRNTSNRFCERLAETSVSFKKNPSDEIRDSSWFYEVFDLDPTVKAMLNMLDAIHLKYGEIKLSLYESLEKLRFYVLPLNGFDLTDELYVKMNARGKPLTGFENFKADLFKWLKSKENEKIEKFNSEVNYFDRKIKYHFALELKFDIDWTGLFWNYSKSFEKQEQKLVDTYFHHFINRYLLNRYILDSGVSLSDIENNAVFKSLYRSDKDEKKLTYKSFDNYKEVLKLDPAGITIGLEKVLDGLKLNIDAINELIRPNWNKADSWTVFNTNINLRQRIVFFAISIYIENNEFDKEKFKDWMRIVWNIIVDPNLRSVPAMVTAMTYISALSHHSGDILTHISKTNTFLFKNNNTYETQLKEEYLKARLIVKDKNWEEELIIAEKHKLFQGKIGFLLTEEAQMDIDLFIKHRDVAINILQGNDLSDTPDNYLWIRAILSKCVNFEIGSGVDLSNGRFSNWRELINGLLTVPMQSLIEDIAESQKSAKDRMIDLCNKYCVNQEFLWLYPLVNWVGANGKTLLGDYSESRKIKPYNNYGRSPNYVYLFNKNIWTDGNILLDTERNKLVSLLIEKYPDLKFSNSWFNIQNKFFRDWDVKMTLKINGFEFSLIVDRKDIYVGILNNPNTDSVFANLTLKEIDMPEGWSFRRKYNFENYTSKDLNQVIFRLNEDIFNEQNNDSLLSKIKDKP
ncbi:MAG: DUF262 domain-containing protein [Bacteroidota bacterium]